MHDVGREGDLAYMAMEPLPGTDLRQRMREARLPLRETLDLVRMRMNSPRPCSCQALLKDLPSASTDTGATQAIAADRTSATQRLDPSGRTATLSATTAMLATTTGVQTVYWLLSQRFDSSGGLWRPSVPDASLRRAAAQPPGSAAHLRRDTDLRAAVAIVAAAALLAGLLLRV